MKTKTIAALVLIALTTQSCHEVDSDRIPAASVYVDLSYNWEIYGVHSMGEYRYFIRGNKSTNSEPANFPYNADARTGFGGLLLTCDAQNQPLVYDMACPYERTQNIRVRIDSEDFNVAECEKCHSRYNVTEFFGSAISGPAKDHRYGLTRYVAQPVSYGSTYVNGYILRR